MIQQRPVCFDCRRLIATNDEIVWSPPMQEREDSPSANFHGVCLMRWRERRAEVKAEMQVMREAFERHLDGKCDCEQDD